MSRIHKLGDICVRTIFQNLHSYNIDNFPLELRQHLLKEKGKFLTEEQLVNICSKSLSGVAQMESLSLSTKGFLQIFSFCQPQLTQLHLANSDTVTDEVMYSIYKSCPGLVVLTVEFCNSLSSAAFSGIGKGCPGIVSFSSSCPSKTSSFSCKFTEASFLDLKDLCNLKCLSVQNWACITDNAIGQFVQTVRKLEYLRLQNCRLVTEKGIIDFLTSNLSICTLDVSGCLKVTNLVFTSENLKPLKYLNEVVLYSNNKINDEGMIMLISSAPLLSLISLSYCDFISDKTLEALECLKNLTQLELRFMHKMTAAGTRWITKFGSNLKTLKWESSNVNFGDQFLSLIGSSCPYFQELFLDKTPALTDEGILKLASGCPELTLLILSDCPRITDKSLCFLGQMCTNLQTLILGNRMVTDEGLTGLVTTKNANCGCTSLRTLVFLDAVYSVRETYGGISDKGFQMLSLYCTNLTSLCIADLDVSYEGVKDFLHLAELNIRGCSKFNSDEIKKLVETCWNLRELTLSPEQVQGVNLDYLNQFCTVIGI